MERPDPPTVQVFRGAFVVHVAAEGYRRRVSIEESDSDYLSSAPVAVLERAASCVRFVLASLKIELDFTPETLPLVDHWLGEVRKAKTDAEEELKTLAAEAAGAYFGEVVRRSLGEARWQIDPDPSRWRIEMASVFLAFNPLGMAEEALAEAALEGWNAHLEVLPQDRGLLEQTLSHLGDVRADDYYRLAVRWEVIEQVVAALEAAKIARGDAAQTFGPQIYRATLDAEAPETQA